MQAMVFDSGLHQGACDITASASQHAKNADKREQCPIIRWMSPTSDLECLNVCDEEGSDEGQRNTLQHRGCNMHATQAP